VPICEWVKALGIACQKRQVRIKKKNIFCDLWACTSRHKHDYFFGLKTHSCNHELFFTFY